MKRQNMVTNSLKRKKKTFIYTCAAFTTIIYISLQTTVAREEDMGLKKKKMRKKMCFFFSSKIHLLFKIYIELNFTLDISVRMICKNFR